jgi:hypothetical protein
VILFRGVLRLVGQEETKLITVNPECRKPSATFERKSFMLTKRTFYTVLIAGAIAASTSAAQAQSIGAGPQTQESQGDGRNDDRNQNAIVGSWVGTVGDGNRAINSFTSDGIMFGSVQAEVSLSLGEVLTPIHGAWTHLGGRQFLVTTTGLLYDIQTGESHGSVKIHVLFKINSSGDRLTGTEKVQLFGPDGTLLDTFPPGTVQFNRVKVEPFD